MNAISSSSLPKEASTKVLIKLPSDLMKLIQISVVGFIIWYFCKPIALSDQAWRLAVVFVSTIVALIVKPFPMGTIAITSVCVLCLTQTISLQTALQGFAYDQLWLIVLACFLARGFIKTGLGARIAYSFVAIFGTANDCFALLLTLAFLLAALDLGGW